MAKIQRGFLITFAMLGLWRPVVADDIDLFVRADPSSDAPNVLFVIDNAANFESKSDARCIIDGVPTALDKTVGGIEQCALHNVISALPAGSVRIGVMVYKANNVVNHLGVDCTGEAKSDTGGCLVYPITLMTEAKKAELLTWIKQWKTTGTGNGYIKANSEATGAVMQEAWAYLVGRTGLSGTAYPRDLREDACSNYIIFLGNSYSPSGSPGDQTGDKGPRGALEGTNTTLRMNASPAATAEQKVVINKTITTSCGTATLGAPHESKGYYADEWSRYLNASGVTTYTIGLLGDGCQADYAATLTSMAGVGGGKYFPTRNYDELVTALQTALSEMLSVNSVFASVSLPISVNTEGTYLNQVYIGMFRPNKATLPRWVGNLKQYRLGRADGTLKLLDAKAVPEPAISSAGTGFLAACALSYWTPTVEDEYWELMTERNCGYAKAQSNTPDGPIVEKGAQGHRLRSIAVADRNLKTCDAACGSNLVNFSTANAAITKEKLKVADDATRNVVINWTRGADNRGNEGFDPPGDMRPSVHGDVVHSRPVAIDYSPRVEAAEPDDVIPDPEVVVFYGGNDGVLRAINGNRTASIPAAGGVGAGREIWGFIPPEFYGQLNRLREDSPKITLKGLEDDGAEREPKPYGFDGPIVAHTEGDGRWIYATMRRGGRMVYAFDVSELNTNPSSPKLLWRFGCPNLDNDVGCTPGSSRLGQTWSAPKVFKTGGYKTGATLNPMLIMGGGYDKCEDTDPHSCNDPDKVRGDAIFVLDAETGSVLKSFPTDRPVTADVFVVPDGKTGRAKLAYVVDLGGNVYRISGINANAPFGDTAPDSWTMIKIASLGCGTPAPCAANRKFMYAPDVVLDDFPDGYVLLVGSGDREKPLHADLVKDGDNDGYPFAYNTENHFFMLRDFPASAKWLEDEEAKDGEPGPCKAPLLCMASLLEIGRDDPPVSADLEGKKGWYLALNKGEQVVTSAITVFGGTTFSTHEPTDPLEKEACTSDLGTARVYNVRYASGAPAKPGAVNRYEKIAGGGLPPSPVAGLVKLDDGTIVPFIIGSDGASPLEGGEPVSPTLSTLPKSITYWYIEK
jgi:type IV pilus assembly protein PilY1